MLIGSPRRDRCGFTLIELVIGLTITVLAILLVLPSYSNWMQNAQIRSAGETTLAGLQLAHLEAVTQNQSVLFQLMSSLDGGCAPSTSGGNWVVSQSDATGSCGTVTAPDPVTLICAAPCILQEKSSTEGTNNVTFAASQDVIIFDSLGRVTNAASDPITIDLTNTAGGGKCVTHGGQRRCLRIEVNIGGQVRMCDPAITIAGDPRTC